MEQDGAARVRRRIVPVCGAAASALCLLAALKLCARCGAGAAGALAAWLIAALGVFVPGIFAVRMFCRVRAYRNKEPLPGAVLAALAVLWGFALFLAASLAASVLRAPSVMRGWWEMWAVYGVMRLVLPASHRALREDWQKARRFLASGTGAALAFAACALIGLNALYAVRYAHPAAVGALVPSQDFFWNLGNVQSFSGGLPLADLRVAGVTVTYHFLTELFEAGLWFAVNLPAYDVVAFYAYAPIAAALVVCLYALGRTLWRDSPRRAVLLAYLPLWCSGASLWKVLGTGASRFGNGVTVHTLSNINGQATAFVCLALTLLFLARLFEKSLRGAAWEWLSLALAFYGLAFAKGPQAGVLAIAVFCAAALWCAQDPRGRVRPAAALCLLLPAGFAVLYRFYFAAGAASSMRFSPAGTVKLFYFSSILNALQIRFPRVWGAFLPLLWLAQSFLMAPAPLCAWVCAAMRDVRARLRVSPLRLVLHACTFGGLAAFFLFDHYSSSQIYFANLAVFTAGLFLLDSLPALWHTGRGRLRRFVRAGAACLLAVGCLTSLCLFASVGRTAADTLAGRTQPSARAVLTADEERACAWLAENLPEGALFATNRMHTGTALEGLSNVYSGLSGRGAYMESFKYAVSNMGAGAGDVESRYAEMETLFSAGTPPETVRALCDGRGIRCLLFCPLLPGDEAQLAAFPCVFDSTYCRIYQIN